MMGSYQRHIIEQSMIEGRRIADKADKVRKIISGSCTPAQDLLVMVDDGELTAYEAGQALRLSSQRMATVADIRSAAAFEIDNERKLGG